MGLLAVALQPAHVSHQEFERVDMGAVVNADLR
jgi:hypothetical protein